MDIGNDFNLCICQRISSSTPKNTSAINGFQIRAKLFPQIGRKGSFSKPIESALPTKHHPRVRYRAVAKSVRPQKDNAGARIT